MDLQPSKPSGSVEVGGYAGGGEIGDVIEGGDVTELRELEVKSPHRETTARLLAVLLVSILGGSALLHYVTLAVFAYSGRPLIGSTPFPPTPNP